MDKSLFYPIMRISGRNLKNIQTALSHRSAILENSLKDGGVFVKIKKEEYPYGENVKMVRKHKMSLVLLKPTEKDEVVTKYESGMTMAAIADEYGCHYTTVGRLLRKNGIVIRE